MKENVNVATVSQCIIQKITVPMTLIMTRQMSNILLCGLRARNVISVAPLDKVPSKVFAHTGCESTYASQSTFVCGFSIRTNIVSWFFGLTIVISSGHFIVGRVWWENCCACAAADVNWTLGDLTGTHCSSALGCHSKWLLQAATRFPNALYPVGQWRKQRSPENVSPYIQFAGNIVPYSGFARRGHASAMVSNKTKKNLKHSKKSLYVCYLS